MVQRNTCTIIILITENFILHTYKQQRVTKKLISHNDTLPRVMKIAGLCIFLFGIVLFFSASPNNAVNHQAVSISQPSIPGSSDTQPAQFPGKITYITRFMQLDGYGTFSTQDIIAFINDGNAPIQYFFVCLNQSEAVQMYDMIAQTVAGERLYIEAQPYTLNGFSTWKITLASPLLPGAQGNLTVWQYFTNATVVTTNSTTANFVLFHTLYTIVPYSVDFTKTTVTIPALSSPTPPTMFADKDCYPAPLTTTSNQLIYTNSSALPFNSAMLYMNFTNSATFVVKTTSSTVTVEVSATSDLKVSDDVVIQNFGIPAVPTLMFIVPKDAYGINAVDSLAYIKGIHDDNLTWGNFKNITMDLTYTRYPIKTNERFSFTFYFMLPKANRLVTGDTKNAISLDLFQLCFNPWAMENVRVQIALPQATSIDILNVIPDAVNNVNDVQYIVYTQTGTSLFSTKLVTVVYTYNLLAMQTRPLLIALIVGLAAMFLIIGRKLSMQGIRPIEQVKAEVPVDELKEYTDIFEEKISTFIELDNLNSDFNRRKVKKREYLLKIEDLNRQLKHLDQQIKPSKKVLIDAGGRFKEIITELDVLEAERQSIQDSMIALEKRYKDGQIKSRAAYEQLFETYNVRFKKIESSIDSGVNELRSYVP